VEAIVTGGEQARAVVNGLRAIIAVRLKPDSFFGLPEQIWIDDGISAAWWKNRQAGWFIYSRFPTGSGDIAKALSNKEVEVIPCPRLVRQQ
jgi:hypothetical protein